MPDQLRQGLVLVFVGLVVFLTRLGSTHLWDDDETFFAEVAREMHERDDLIVPWFNQRLFAHKPPFMYWMMIGAYRSFGITEFAARFPSALFGLATVLLVWRLGRILYSPRAGFWAGIVLATSLNFTVISRAATSDAELSFFCTLALYLFVRGTAVRGRGEGSGVRDQRLGEPLDAPLVWRAGESNWLPSWGTWAAIYATMGLAALVKGPIGVLLPTSIIGLFLVWRGREESGMRNAECGVRSAKCGVRNGDCANSALRIPSSELAPPLSAFRFPLSALPSPWHIFRTIWSMRPLTALAAVLLVAGPWYATVGSRTKGAFLAGFFGIHHFGRFLNPMDNHPGPSWYYLAAMCVGFFPWIVFLSPTLIHWYRRIRDRHEWHPADVLCGAWWLVWFGFFSLASTKFPHYVVPAYPALALVTAAFLDRWIADNGAYPLILRRSAWTTVGIAGIGIMVIVPMIQQQVLHDKGFAGLTGLPLIAGAVAGAYFTERKRVSAALAGLSGSAIAFLLLLFAFAAVEVDRHQNSELLAKAIRTHAGNERPQIGHFHYFRPGLSFYCREHIEPQIRPEDAVSFLHAPPPRYLLTSSKLYAQLKPEFPADTEVLAELPWFLKRGKGVVLLGRRAADRSVTTQAPVSERSEDSKR